MREVVTPLIKAIGWLGVGIFVLLLYHIACVPALLDYSHYALLAMVVGVPAVFFGSIPKRWRRSIMVFLVATLFIFQALNNVRALEHGWLMVAGALLVFLVVGWTARWYGRLSGPQLVAACLAAGLMIWWAPGTQLRVWNHFVLLEETEPVYVTENFPYFPVVTLTDHNSDRSYIVTWGNREESNPKESPDVLETELIYPYVFEWDEGLQRVPWEYVSPAVQAAVLQTMSVQYPGFPYYRWEESTRLLPTLSTQQLVHQMLRFGENPWAVMDLNWEVLSPDVQAVPTVWDVFAVEGASGLTLHLLPGILRVEVGETILETETTATRIVGVESVEEGWGLFVQGRHLDRFLLEGDDLTHTHRLDDEGQGYLGRADILLADITRDGRDEVLLSSTEAPSRILKPEPDGTWRQLWLARSDDESFRFEDVMTDGDAVEIVALDRSRVRNHPLRYLSGYSYASGTLYAQWRSLVTLVDVQYVDLTGDGRHELVGTRYGEHRLWVLRPHGVPVVPLLWGLTLVGLVVLRIWSWRRSA